MSSLSTQMEWAQTGNAFSARSRADKASALPGGIYKFVPTMTGWFLERNDSQFSFPFKVYSAGQYIIDRIIKSWSLNGGNLGVLMNGLRGAGKTMTAQLLANRLIQDRDLPVLVVREPIPLESVFNAVQQDMMVIFDEFEKTHRDKEDQEALLSTIDGMGRSEHARLIIFTTNSPKIDENFRDRPSRIHYQFEFQRVPDDLLEGLINDGLPKHLAHLKPEILDYLSTRALCTIDIVKAVLSEVRNFEESPIEFEHMLNISKGEPPAFTIYIVDPDTNAIKETFCEYFKPKYGNSALLIGSKHAISEFVDNRSKLEVYCEAFDGSYGITFLEKCEEDGCWLAHLAVPATKTFYSQLRTAGEARSRLYIDKKPSDWVLPSVTPDEDGESPLLRAFFRAEDTQTIYGTQNRKVFKIKVEPNRTPIYTSIWKVDRD